MEFLLAETTIAAMITYLIMVFAFKYSHIRKFHITTMVSCVLFDLLMPVYLILYRDWYGRLIEGGEIMNFLIWMHLGLVITLFVLYFLQIQLGRKLLQGEEEHRQEHKVQGKGILLTRFMVILTGGLLFEAEAS